MKCQEIEDLMPDYLQGKLNSDRAVLVEEHMGQCTRCAEEVEIWKKLASLPQEQPSPAVRERFAAMLETYQQGRWKRPAWLRSGKNSKALANSWHGCACPP